MSRRALIIVGPTASGKTSLAIELAKQLNGEVISADSRQLFRFMNIGTATPSPQEMAGVPHHFIDIKDPDEFFSAGSFGNLAREMAAEIVRRGRQPIIAGGSGLYIRALTDGIFSGQHRNLEIRAELKKEADQKGLSVLHRELERVDPESAAKIHPNDAKRLIRALEIFRLTGQPMSQVQQEQTEPWEMPFQIWGLDWPRPILYQRIETRVDAMLAQGLVEEVASLLKMGYSLADNSMDSVGYKEIIAFLNGQCALDEAVALIKRNTRRFAKRQMTWFRRDDRIQWISLSPDVDLLSVSQTISNQFLNQP